MEAISDIGDEMARQNNLSTRYPLWVVMERVKVYVGYEMPWDKRERNLWDGMDDEEYATHLCEDCRKLFIQSGYTDLPTVCPTDECDDDSYRFYNEEDQPNLNSGMYLTQKACQQHIDENRYHYTDPRTYAYSAWRNPEMIAVMQFILKSANQEVPNYYQ